MKKIKDRKNKIIWNYLTKEEIDKNLHTEKWDICGEVAINDIRLEGEGIRKQIINNEKEFVLVQRNGTYTDKRYKTIGYLATNEENEYIVVRKKKNFIVWILLFVLLFIMVGWLAMTNIQRTPHDIDPNASEFTGGVSRPENIESSRILVPGYGKFTINEGDEMLNTVFFNPEGNPVYFKFTLIEKESGEVLYQSKLVPPGQGITSVKLNKIYNKAGTYPMILKFQSIDLEDTEIEYNGSDMEVNLIVVKKE